jgi:adenosylhomocysteine nucleosidase
MRILVTFAVDAEFAPWRKLRAFRRVASEQMDCYSAEVHGAEIHVLLTGMGRKKAGVEATKAIWDADVDFCISSGLAGGLRPEHLAGEILVPAEVVNAEGSSVACDGELTELAERNGAKRVGNFYTGSDVVLLAHDKKKLGEKADAVEMESFDILKEAKGFGSKVVAVRAVSDTVDEDLPLDFNRVATDEGEVSLAKVFGQIALNPAAIGPLVRFGRQSRMAAEKLSIFLDGFVDALAKQSKELSTSGAGTR